MCLSKPTAWHISFEWVSTNYPLRQRQKRNVLLIVRNVADAANIIVIIRKFLNIDKKIQHIGIKSKRRIIPDIYVCVKKIIPYTYFIDNSKNLYFEENLYCIDKCKLFILWRQKIISIIWFGLYNWIVILNCFLGYEYLKLIWKNNKWKWFSSSFISQLINYTKFSVSTLPIKIVFILSNKRFNQNLNFIML